ncbi:hypothetical protein BHM03_00035789 [Ensete ventricosum]|nr:hypothetical protein BHM03_00035789 [Ensete ventricosum]
MEGSRATRSSDGKFGARETAPLPPGPTSLSDCELGLPTHANESIPRTRAKTAMSQDEGRGSLDKYRAPQTGAGGVKGES